MSIARIIALAAALSVGLAESAAALQNPANPAGTETRPQAAQGGTDSRAPGTDIQDPAATAPSDPAEADAEAGPVELLPDSDPAAAADVDEADADTAESGGAGRLALLAGVGVLAAGLVGVGYRARRRGHGRHRGGAPAQLFVPPGLASRSDGTAPRRLEPLPKDLPSADRNGVAPPSIPLFQYPPQVNGGAVTPGYGSSRTATAYPTSPVREAAVAAPPPQVAEEVQIGPVRFHAPPDGTLQMLPGRLEILGGTDHAEEIRFVRIPGREPVITFGRSQGQPHSHIRLEALTVSRVHAAMHFRDERWHVENLSRTNPVQLNGTAMAATNSGLVALADGDTIEMGEVTFRFRER